MTHLLLGGEVCSWIVTQVGREVNGSGQDSGSRNSLGFDSSSIISKARANSSRSFSRSSFGTPTFCPFANSCAALSRRSICCPTGAIPFVCHRHSNLINQKPLGEGAFLWGALNYALELLGQERCLGRGVRGRSREKRQHSPTYLALHRARLAYPEMQEVVEAATYLFASHHLGQKLCGGGLRLISKKPVQKA
jgi:hypothetical protein